MRNCYKFETRSSTKTKQKEKEIEHKTEPPKHPQQKPHKHKKYKDKPGWVIYYPHRQVCASNPATRLQVQDLYDGKSSLVKYEDKFVHLIQLPDYKYKIYMMANHLL